MNRRGRFSRLRHALLPLVLLMVGCEKIDGLAALSGWTKPEVVVAIIGVIVAIVVARNRPGSGSKSTKIEAGGTVKIKKAFNQQHEANSGSSIEVKAGEDVLIVDSYNTTNHRQSGSGDRS
jgi:hypothetical protein